MITMSTGKPIYPRGKLFYSPDLPPDKEQAVTLCGPLLIVSFISNSLFGFSSNGFRLILCEGNFSFILGVYQPDGVISGT